MTKIKKIPNFKTITEEAKFWDTHDVSDYLSEMKDVKVSFNLLAPKGETLTIRLQSNLKRKLENLAKYYGVNISTLARIWFIDKLQETKSRKLAV
jgi:predicted DNA binding CopG/RHH family protein